VPADLNDLPLDRLYETLASDGMIRRLFELARDEDLGEKGDLTSKAWFTDDAPVRAHVSFREPGIVAGIACIEMICDVFAEVLGARVSCEIHLHDGERADKDAHAATIEGPRSAIVGVERTVLNIVGRLSGIATLAAKYVEAASTGKTRLLDTRKTTPGLRALEKYAVRCGGGARPPTAGSHRASLPGVLRPPRGRAAGSRGRSPLRHSQRSTDRSGVSIQWPR